MTLHARFWFVNHFEEDGFQWVDSTVEGYHITDNPSMFIFCFEEMFERFKIAGKVTYLMYMDFALKGKESRDKWDLLIVSGLTLNYMLEPFAFAFVNQKYKNLNNTAIIINKIFDYYQAIPKVIVTPVDIFYEELIYELTTKYAFEGIHLFDPLIEIDRIGSFLDRYDDLVYFKNVILCRTQG